MSDGVEHRALHFVSGLANRSARVFGHARPAAEPFLRRLMCRTMFSTMTTAPSTTIPKSSAPSESRLTGTLVKSSKMEAKKQRERNGQRHDEGRAGIEQKQEKDDGHQNHPFSQVVQHRVQGEAEQIAAVDHPLQLHARRQDAVVELLHFGVKLFQRRPRVGALAHHHLREDDIVVVDDHAVFPADGPSLVAQANLRALAHFRDVLDAKRRPGLRGQDRLLDILHIAEEPDACGRSSAAGRSRRSCRRR